MEKANKPVPSYVGIDVSKHRLDVLIMGWPARLQLRIRCPELG
jgi:hypothetical protein